MAGTYTLSSTAENRTDVLFGARMADVSQTLDWSLNGNLGDPPLVSRSGTARLDITNWDAIVGLKGHAFLDNERKWFVPYYLDVGTGQSKLTWQLNLGLGYRFDWGSVIAAWRYLDYQMKSGDPIQDMTLNGALVGVAFKF